MNREDVIINKAKQLGLTTFSDISSRDNLYTIANQVGFENFNDEYDIDELERVLDSELNRQLTEDSIRNEENGNDQSNMTYSKRENNFGREEYEKTLDDKDYYRNRNSELSSQREDQQKSLNEARDRRNEALNNKKDSNTKENKDAYRKANRDYKNAKKDLKGTTRDLKSNKLDDIKNKMYQANHPLEAAKDKLKSNIGQKGAEKAGKKAAESAGKKAASNAGKTAASKAGKAAAAKTGKQAAAQAGKKAAAAAGKAAAQALKTLGSAIIRLITSNPYVALAIAIIILVLFLLLLFIGSPTNYSSGYYNEACDFTSTTVGLNICGTDNIEEFSLEDYVVGMTYSYTNGEDYSKESIKALMIIIQTNALSNGNYNNTDKYVEIDDCEKSYTYLSNINDMELKNLQRLFNDIKELLYLDDTYTSTIVSLSSDNSLPITDSVINNLKGSNLKYEEILNELYNSESEGQKKYIYKLADNCTFYSMTSNGSYWWPIGSEKPTQGNIYGGQPTSTTINSYFGPRNVAGKSGNHGAIDIGGNCNKEVVIATTDGEVTTVNDTCDNNGYYGNPCGGKFGNYVMIDHGDGLVTIYGHMYPKSITVKKGDKVEKGQKLGLLGNSGSSTGCHLHFEVRLNNTKVDPLNYVDPENPRPTGGLPIGGIDDPIDQSQNKAAICSSLIKSGYSQNAVAGILVNLSAEGGFKTNNLENCYETGNCCKVNGKDYGYCVHTEIGQFGSDTAYTQGVDSGKYPKEKFINDHAGYGICQWTPSGRKSGLYDLAKGQNKSIASLSVQVGYMINEINNKSGYEITKKYITGNYSAYEIANNFCLNFESPANKNKVCPNRASGSSDTMLNYVKNNCS